MSCPPGCRRPTPAQAHCATCHRTFGGVFTFDLHRRDGRCLDPATMPGLAETNGIWRQAMTERKRAQLARLTGTRRAPGDHPHTDPEDGRSECDACGKFVWPAIHSCKGVPVTPAALDRMAARRAEGA